MCAKTAVSLFLISNILVFVSTVLIPPVLTEFLNPGSILNQLGVLSGSKQSETPSQSQGYRPENTQSQSQGYRPENTQSQSQGYRSGNTQSQSQGYGPGNSQGGGPGNSQGGGPDNSRGDGPGNTQGYGPGNSQGYRNGYAQYNSILNRSKYITSGLSVDALLGNNVDLLQWLQSDRIGQGCNKVGKVCNTTNGYWVKDDGCMCDRDCSKYPEPRVCYWKFFAEQYTAMGPACRNCSGGNTTECYQYQCVVGDGREKTVYVINRMLPGPLMRACKYDLIIVDVINLMTSAALTIHWHGMLQERTPFMDGAPYVNQCPIPPNGQFRYKFPALTTGTLWWHAHIGSIQRDGCAGALIIKEPREHEPYYFDYDYDLACHTIIVDDWQQFLFDYQFPGYNKNQSHIPIKSEGYIINGLGSFNDGTTVTNTPHAQFHVECGKKYRMRVISSTSITCLYEFAIDGHYLKVIATDGNPVQPVNVRSIVMGPGMRTDFILNANRCAPYQNTTGNCSFYMAVRALDGCATLTLPQTAYVVYNCCDIIPTSTLNLTRVFGNGPYLDFVERGCNNSDVICSHELRSPEPAPDPRLVYGGKCEHRVFWNVSGYLYTYNDLFNNSVTPYQVYYQPVGGLPPVPGGGIFSDTMNNINCILPPSPLLDRFPIPENFFCSNDCKTNYCSCVNILRFPYNSCVEFVFNDVLGANHPFHIHGHQWYVLKMGSPAEKNQTNYWLNIDKTKYPSKRDVTITPAMGYTVVRWIANNPGIWMFHCHFTNHLLGGMFAMLQVGERNQFVPLPKDFPRCEPYLPKAYEALGYSRSCKAKRRDHRWYSQKPASYNSPSPHGHKMSMSKLKVT